MQGMVRSFVSLAAVLAAVLCGVPVEAQPGPQELRAAILTADEAGPGWVLERDGSIRPGFPSYYVQYARRDAAFELLQVFLVDGRLAEPDPLAQAGINALVSRAGFTSARADPPAIGEGTVRYALSGNVAGTALTVDVIGWRHEDVVALVVSYAEGQANALEYAIRQQAKLEAMFGSSVAAITETEAERPPPGPTEQVELVTDCNNLTSTWPNGTPSADIAAGVSPAPALRAIWRFDAAAGRFVGFSPQFPSASDLRTVNRLDPVFRAYPSRPAAR